MELTSYQTDGILHITTRLLDEGCVVEYHNKNDQRHREDGPAIKAKLQDQDNEYFEWWKEGKLIALFNKNKNAFLKSKDGTHESLYKIQLPEQWTGSESSLSLEDINLIN